MWKRHLYMLNQQGAMMKAKFRFLCVLLIALGVGVACNRAPNDAQVANQIQQKINADGNIQNKQIGVQSANGVVTLSGTVGSELERSAAANDAAQVAGVKTVVNNIDVNGTTAAQSTPPAAEPAETASSTAKHRPTPRRTESASNTTPATATYNNPPANNMGSAAAMTPSAPPAPRVVTVPEGTVIAVRLVDAINTAQS